VSSTRDITALILMFEPEGDETAWTVVCRFWVPEDTLDERVTNDRVPYDKWLADGAIETTPGNFVDQNYVQKAVLEAVQDFDVMGFAYDPWNAMKLVADLQAEGLEPEAMLAVRQGIPSLGEPTKMFERLVYAGKLDHGWHPILRWMAKNAVVRFDENLNYAPAKKRSAEKIDGIVAAVMCLAVPTLAEEEAPSVYETRGIVEVELEMQEV
jgi:phage terminase large subunit-like protein